MLDVTSAQAPADAALKFNVTLSKSPPSITLEWNLVRISGYDFTSKSFSVYRTNPDNLASFGAAVQTIPIVTGVNAYSYVDTDIEIGVAYEYRVHCSFPEQDIEGLAVAGIEIPLVEDRGHVILVVEERAAYNMTAEIHQLKMDLIGDGWSVSPIIVAKNISVPQVRAKILEAHGTRNKSTVFVFGSVAVPYSGQIWPDGHDNHIGAWPADVYYTSLTDAAWVDRTVNVNSSSDARNWNWPGDVKFDLSSLASASSPSTVSSLEIGRVDLARFTGQDEMVLLRKYLVKNHGYRHRDPEYTFQQRAVVNDGFGWFVGGEAFSVSGWRTFSSVVGGSNVASGNLFTTLGNTSAIWCLGTGGGSFTSAGTVGSTNDFLTKPMRAAFTMLFGSYFIDWDSNNNFLRAPLAGSHALTSISSGRPYAFFHHMAAGYHTGFSARQSQANDYKYTNAGFYASYIHQNLMGDPTLRMYVVDPPKNVKLATEESNGVSLSWTASSDTVEGYHVYRSTASLEGPFTRITTDLVTSTAYLDTGAVDGNNYYMVRAVQLTRSPTASFYNPSQAAFFETNYVAPPLSSPAVSGPTANAPSASSPQTGGTLVSLATNQLQTAGIAMQLLIGAALLMLV